MTAAAPPRLMLDTNIASAIIKRPNEALRRRLRAVPPHATCISSVTEAELRYGLARKPAATALRAAVELLLQRVTVLPFDSEAATAYGLLRAALEAEGTPLGNLDTLIAAHALACHCTLVTHDHAFRSVRGLAVEDWLDE